MIGPENETNVQFHITAECQQLCSLAHHVTGPCSIFFFCPRQHREDELGSVWRKKPPKKQPKKKKTKKCSKPFKRASLNLSVRWWWKEPIPQLPGAQPFTSFSLFSFLLEKKKFSPVWSPHYINSLLWKHLSILRVKKRECQHQRKVLF